MRHIATILERNRNSVKILVTVVLLSLITVVVNAGNISPGISDSATTLQGLSVIIDSPVDGSKIGNTSINVAYTVTGTGNMNYILDSGSGIELTSNPLILTGLSEDFHNVTIIDVSNGNTLATVNFTVDITPPAEVTNLNETATTKDSITWKWINPTTGDFNNTRITVTSDDIPLSEYNDKILDKTIDSITVYGLQQNTQYNIIVKTEDDAILQ